MKRGKAAIYGADPIRMLERDLVLKKLSAEAFGTFWLVFGGCGSAVLAAGFPDLGIGFAGVALAFGLTVLTMVYAVGWISGAPLQPGGLARPRGRRPHSVERLVPYWVAQVVGGTRRRAPALHHRLGPGRLGAGRLRLATATARCRRAATACSPASSSRCAHRRLPVVILGATAPDCARGLCAGIAIGLCLTLIHLVSIPVTNTSVNPARSTAVAFFAETGALGQLWLFWVAPLVGAALGALIWKALLARED